MFRRTAYVIRSEDLNSELRAPCSRLHADRAVIYQFVPNAPVRVMERLIRCMAPGTMAILDLEDGYLDVRDPAGTCKRREGLV